VLPFHRRLETTAFFYIDAASRLEDDHRFEAFYMYTHECRRPDRPSPDER